MKRTFILSTDTARLMAMRELQSAPEGYVITIGEPIRSVGQNNKTHAWYEEISAALKEYDAQGWKRYCKLHHGVPILRAEDEEFKDFYDAAMKRSLTYEQKLTAMDFVPVTSIMSKPQLSKYCDAVQNDFFAKGVILG
jgi:hypothetical protein